MYSQYYSNGKLLIAGEYLVLRGAKALALPVAYGQSLNVALSSNCSNSWCSYQQKKLWLKIIFDHNFKILSSSDLDKARKLFSIIKAAHKINPSFFDRSRSYQVTSHLNFDLNWGLGSSSTLISNIAYWAGIDPFQLFSQVAGGSGYDVACARSDSPLFYQLKNGKYRTEPVKFKPLFRDKLFFLYLNKKQDSAGEVKKFKQNKQISAALITEISKLSEIMAQTKNQKIFMQSMARHEDIISNILQQPAIKEKLFKDFDGEVKSLGAWGGDFALVCSNISKNNTLKYFSSRGYKTVFTFDEMAIKQNPSLFKNI